MRWFLVVTALVGCGSNNNNGGGPHDGATFEDAPADAPIDVPAAPLGFYQYVIDHITVPQSNPAALANGLDLDGDQHVDNQLGMVFGSLSGMGFDTQTATSHAIDTGALLTLVELYADDFTTSAAPTFTTYDGAMPFPLPCNGAADTVCRHHLAGTAMFTIASGANTPLAGTIAAGELDGGPGLLAVQLAPFGNAVELTLHGARVKLAGPTATGITSGIIGGGILESDIQSKLYPSMATSFASTVQRDCCGLSTSPGGAVCTPPSCGCADGSTGKTVLGLYDANHDCSISVDELSTNSLDMALFASDLMIDSQPAISVGVGFTAVHAAFPHP